MIVFGVVCTLGLFAASFYLALAYPIPITYEGIELWSSWALAHGANIYDPSRLLAEPWIVNIYPPLMSVLAAPFAWQAGQTLLVLRVISGLSFLMTVACFYLLAAKMGAGRGAICGALVFYCTCVPAWFTSLIAKPDYLCLAFESLAFLLFWIEFEQRQALGDPKKAGGSFYLPAALCCLLALLAKQQGLLAPVAIVVYLALRKEYLNAFKFSAVIAVCVAAVGLMLQLVSGGFVQHLTFLRDVSWNVSNINLNMQSLGFDAVKIVLVCFCALIYRPADPDSRRRLAFAVTLFFVCLPELAVIFGIPGATSNHFITPMFALALIAALSGTRHKWIAPTLAIISVILVFDMVDFLRKQTQGAVPAARALEAELTKIGCGRLVLSEDPFWVLAAHDQPVIIDCTTFLNAWRNDPAKAAPMLERINKKAYARAIINNTDLRTDGMDIWTPQLIQALKANYEPLRTVTANGREQTVLAPKR